MSLLPHQALMGPMSFVDLAAAEAVFLEGAVLLAGTPELVRHPEVLENLAALPPVDYRSLILSSVVQAGLDKVAVLEAPLSVENLPPSLREHLRPPFDPTKLMPFVRERVEVLDHLEWLDLGHQIERAIRRSVPDYSVTSTSATMTSHAFLTDLLYALRTGQHIVSSSSLDSLRELSLALPDEVGVPLRNLMADFEPCTPDVCVPCSSVSKEQLVRLREMLGGPGFAAYHDDHRMLGSTAHRVADVVRNLAASSRHLCETNPDIVRVKRTTLSLLSPASLVGAGDSRGFRAGLLTLLAKPIDGWIRSKRRLVLYEVAELVDSITDNRLRQAVRG